MKLGAVYVTETRIGAFAYMWNDPDAPPLFSRVDGNWNKSIAYAHVYPSAIDAHRHHHGACSSDISHCRTVAAFGHTLRYYVSTFVDSFNNRDKADETHEARRILEL